MVSTHESWKQILDLLEARHQHPAYGVFQTALGDAYSAGAADTAYDYNQAQED